MTVTKSTPLVNTLSANLAFTTGRPLKEVEPMVREVIEVLQATLATAEAGSRYSIHGMGVFEVVERPATTARNPRTGDVVAVPERSTVKFKASRSLRSAS